MCRVALASCSEAAASDAVVLGVECNRHSDHRLFFSMSEEAEIDDWRLTTEAFKSWKHLCDHKEVARLAKDDEGHARLSDLSVRAWRRFLRRRAKAVERNPKRGGSNFSSVDPTQFKL